MPKLTRHHAHWPEGVPHTLDLPEYSLYRHLEASAERAPARIAIDYYGRPISYGGLHRAVLNLAGYLQQCLGVRCGDRVLLLMQNCPQFIIAYYAILRANAVVVAINPMSTVDETAYYLGDCGARVAIVTQDMLAKVRPRLDDGSLTGCIVGAYSDMTYPEGNPDFLQIPDFVAEAGQPPLSDREHEFGNAVAAALAPSPIVVTGSDLAVIAYTSGTTGKPKGAMLSHRALALATAQRSLWLDDKAPSSDLLVLPMCHIAGMSGMNQAIFQGRSIVLLARWDAGAVPALIERFRVGRLGGVAPMLIELLARPEFARHDLSSLKRLYVGATPTPVSIAKELEARLGRVPIECYGMTETCGSTHINPPMDARCGCAGIPQIDVDARIIDPENLTELDCNESGEIVINCPTQFIGYWNKPEATREAFVEIDGKPFVRTGDIGHHDEDGYFHITDRLKRMINASGLKIWPSEVEACLVAHPLVQEACVLAAYDEYRGETAKALIVPVPDAEGTISAEIIIEWARTHLAAYKVPRLIEFVGSLPRTLSGKVLWRALQNEQNENDRERRDAARQ
ncbi:AMP-binding protein [Aromatoleum toluolicum]|uniref:AMP-binding protein n=1 Tax=Aromatoleum toluolicum TaxID=90060 RepID=A0ABX1NHS9_9RHOO|nr:AMP-binding protein [Aromatoleum toluolicum]NMF98846.1 AMP-binding protein [Aromatoleum toluolicum]